MSHKSYLKFLPDGSSTGGRPGWLGAGSAPDLMCDVEGHEGHRLTAAAIVGHDGSVWAQSATFPQFKPEEINGITTDFNEPGHLAPTGLHLGGTKYMVIQGEAGAVIRGKKGSGGITIKKTGQALVFGIYEEPVTPGECDKCSFYTYSRS